MSVKFTILGSGSNGNCAYLETENCRVLIDAGFSPRQIRARLAAIGRTPENLTAILITHEHADHICGLFGLAEKLKLPIFCNRETRDALAWIFKEKSDSRRDPACAVEKNVSDFLTALDWRIFSSGDSFELNDLLIETFSVPHDAQDPVGFLIRTCAGNFGFVTDLGHTTRLVMERIRAANVLVLESNHDIKMLQECPHRPWSLKQRILGRHGHLSNHAAAETAAQIMSAELKHLFLAHLSRECNKPELAQNIMAEQLFQIGATHVQLRVAAQDAPCETLTL